MTPRDLTRALAPYGLAPTADGRGIGYDEDAPPMLAAAATVLFPAVLAALTGRPWLGCCGRTGRVEVLNPAGRVPAWAGLVATAGVGRWHRLGRGIRADLPQLFDPPATPPRVKSRSVRPSPPRTTVFDARPDAEVV